MKNIESNIVKDLITPIYGCPEIRSKYTGDHTRQISIIFYHQLCNYSKTTIRAWEVGRGRGCRAVWTVTPPINECMGFYQRKCPLYTLIRPGIWKYFETPPPPPPPPTLKKASNPAPSQAVSRAGDIRKSMTEVKQTWDIHNCWGSD